MDKELFKEHIRDEKFFENNNFSKISSKEDGLIGYEHITNEKDVVIYVDTCGYVWIEYRFENLEPDSVGVGCLSEEKILYLLKALCNET